MITQKRKEALSKMLWCVLNRCLEVNDSHFPKRDTDSVEWSQHAIRRQVLITYYQQQMQKLAEMPAHRLQTELIHDEDEYENELDWMLMAFKPTLPFFSFGLEALPHDMQLMLGLTSQMLALGVSTQMQSMMDDLRRLADMLNLDERSGRSPGKGAAARPTPQQQAALKPAKPLTAEQIQALADRTTERFLPKRNKPVGRKSPKPRGV